MPASPTRKLLRASAAPIFMSGNLDFMGATEGIALDHMALVARRTNIPRSHGTLTIRKMVLNTARTLHTQQTETQPQSFSERGLFACPRALA